MYQKFRDICAVRLVFRLVGDQLDRANQPLLRVKTAQDGTLVAPDAVCHAEPEGLGFLGRKRQHKADGGAAVYTVDEDIAQGINVGEDVLSGERFNQHGRVHCASLG